MKSTLLSVLYLLFSIYNRLATANYCNEDTNHVFCNNGKAFGKPCGPPEQIIFGKVLTNEKEEILQAHNLLRNSVARGNERRGVISSEPQPSASNMRQMSWDKELEEASLATVTKCRLKFSCVECLALGRFKARELMYMREAMVENKRPVSWSYIIQKFYLDDLRNFNASYIQNYRFLPKPNGYAYLVEATVYLVGCAKISFKKHDWFTLLAVCTYGPVEEDAPVIYEEGKPCSNCPMFSICSSTYTNLCSYSTFTELMEKMVNSPYRNISTSIHASKPEITDLFVDSSSTEILQSGLTNVKDSRQNYNKHSQPSSLDSKSYQPNSLDSEQFQANSLNSEYSQPNSLDFKHSQPNSLDSEHSEPNLLDSKHYEANSVDYKHSQPDLTRIEQNSIFSGQNSPSTEHSQPNLLDNEKDFESRARSLKNSQSNLMNSEHHEQTSERFPQSSLNSKYSIEKSNNSEQSQQNSTYLEYADPNSKNSEQSQLPTTEKHNPYSTSFVDFQQNSASGKADTEKSSQLPENRADNNETSANTAGCRQCISVITYKVLLHLASMFLLLLW